MANLKQKLRNCEPVAAMHVNLADPCVSELCGGLGFDFLWIDTEHTVIDYPVLETYLMAAKASGTDTIVRIPWNDPIMAKIVLEMEPQASFSPW